MPTALSTSAVSSRPKRGPPAQQPPAGSDRLAHQFMALVGQTAVALGLEVSPLALGRLKVVPLHEAPTERQLTAWGLDGPSAKFCRRQAKNGDSSFWPGASLVLLRQTSRIHMAEEAAHVLRHALTPLSIPNDPVDAFYMRAVEEGLAFFASKLLCPRRATPDWQTLFASDDRVARQVAKVAAGHLAQECGLRTSTALYPSAPAVSDAVAHLLGYRIGDALYRAHKESLCDERKVRALFLRTTSGRGEACLLYWQLVLALRDFLSPPGPRYPEPEPSRAGAPPLPKPARLTFRGKEAKRHGRH